MTTVRITTGDLEKIKSTAQALRRGQQLEVPGVETEHPDVLEQIYAWQDDKDEAASTSKNLRDKAKASEAKALELLAEKGLKSYRYFDRATGKWKRFLGVSETKAKTVAAGGGEPRARKDDAPAKDAPPKPTKAERDAARVESRRVPRTAEHDQAADPFAGTRGLLDEARANEADDGQVTP